MIKNLLIISVIILLIATISNLSPVGAQTPESKSLSSKKLKEIPPGDEYHRNINERLVIESLKSLYNAEAEYSIYAGGGNYGNFSDLFSVELIDPVLASGEKYGYYYWMTYWNAGAGNPPAFVIYATPKFYRRTGKRSFFIDASCRVRGADHGGTDASVNDPIIDTCSPYLSYQWEYDMTQGMKSLQSAQEIYLKGAGNGEYGTLDDLINAGLINYFIAYNWYTWLTIDVTLSTKSSPARFRMWGVPQIYRETGIRSFYADETGVLRGADLEGAAADENTPPLSFDDEDLAKYAMRSLWRAQRNYRGLEGFGEGYYADELSTLSKNGMIDIGFPGNTYGGYRFEMTIDNNEEAPWLRNYQIRATPVTYGKGTMRSFYISDRSMLRGADKGGADAEVTDPIVEF